MNQLNSGIKMLASKMIDDETASDSPIPLAFVFLGQFVDHDITFDPISKLDERLDPHGIINFRTPALDLDSVYANGPDVSRHLYDTRGSDMEKEHRLPIRLLTGAPSFPKDLPRNSQGTAIIGDPRNDENLLVSQVHAAFLRFHNKVVEKIILDGNGNPLGNREIFETDRQSVITNYHWILLKEFLPFIIDNNTIDDILTNGRKYFLWEKSTVRKPFIPVEFAGAAYRMGHTMVRSTYIIRDDDVTNPVELFHLPFFGLEKPTPDRRHEPVKGGYETSKSFDMAYFVDTGVSEKIQFCRPIDSFVAKPLFDLPFIHRGQDAPESLPERNMRRARVLGVSSGQEIAKAMGVMPLGNEALGISGIEGLHDQAPLWFYILRESGLAGGLPGC